MFSWAVSYRGGDGQSYKTTLEAPTARDAYWMLRIKIAGDLDRDPEAYFPAVDEIRCLGENVRMMRGG